MILSGQQITFIGAGSMAEALLRGIVEAKLVQPSSIAVLNRQNDKRLEELKKNYGVRVPETNTSEERQRLVREADIVVLAVKPKDVGAAIAEFGAALRPEQLLLSVVAGLAIGTLERLLGRAQPIVRTMPNTSSTILLGAAGVACSPSVNEAQRETALAMLRSVGCAVPVEEDRLNLITGLSGSGPAYVYYLMEAMIDAGTAGGLSPETARALVVQTVLGAARMVESTGEDPSVLRAKVTSPNGTTHAAIGVLDEYRFQEALMQAIRRAEARAAELGEEAAAAALKERPAERSN